MGIAITGGVSLQELISPDSWPDLFSVVALSDVINAAFATFRGKRTHTNSEEGLMRLRSSNDATEILAEIQ